MAENSKKFLWLGAAVSLFALIVVGAAFILFSPGKSAQEVPLDMAGKAEPRQDFPQDYVADAPQSDNLVTSTTSAGDIIIVYGNDQTSGSDAKSAQSKPAATTIYVSPTPTTTLAKQTQQPAAQPVPQPAPAVKAAPKAAPSPIPAPTPAPTVTTVKAPAKAAPAPAKAPAPASGDFWIQAGSFSVRDNADALKASLAAKSLPAAISVKDVDGKSRYTVRVGPYATRAEASKWLSAAQSVKGAEKAWITQ
jgi:cell division protein FtsN